MKRYPNEFNGHRNWAYWNVCLYIWNDYTMYLQAKYAYQATRNLDTTARYLFSTYQNEQGTDNPETPDGARYSIRNIRAAISNLPTVIY